MITKHFKFEIADLLKKWINHFSPSDLIFKSSAFIADRLRKKVPEECPGISSTLLPGIIRRSREPRSEIVKLGHEPNSRFKTLVVFYGMDNGSRTIMGADVGRLCQDLTLSVCKMVYDIFQIHYSCNNSRKGGVKNDSRNS